MTTADRQVADSSVACEVSKVGKDEKCGSDVKDLNKFVGGAVAGADCNGNGGTAVVVDANGGSKDDSDDSYVFITNGTDEVSADPTSDTADFIIAQSDSSSCLVSNVGDAVVEMKEFTLDDGLSSSSERESNCIVPEIAHGVCLEVQVDEFSAENGATTAGCSVVDTSCILRDSGNGDAYLGEPPLEKKIAEAAGDVNDSVNVETESRDQLKVDDRIEPESAPNGIHEAVIPNGAVSPEANTDDVGMGSGLKVDDRIEPEIAGNLEDAGKELSGTAGLEVASPDHFNCVKVEDQIKSTEALVDAINSVNVEAGSGDHVECGVKVDARIEPHSPPNGMDEAETLNGTVCLEEDDGVADSGLRVGDQTESEITPNLVNAEEELTGAASLEGVSQDHVNCEAKVEDEIESLSTPSSVDAVGGPLGYVGGVEAKPQDHVTTAVKVEDPVEPVSVPNPKDEVKELERTVGLEAYSDNPPSSVAKVEYQIQRESSHNLIDAVVELNETASIVEAESEDHVSTAELIEDWIAPDSAPTSVELTADSGERPESSTRSVESGDVMAKHAEESNFDEIVAPGEINTSQNEVLEYEMTEMALGEVKVQEEPQLHSKADVKESPESITQDSKSVELDEIHVKEMDDEVIKSEVQPELDVSGKVEESSIPLVDMISVEYDKGEVGKINDEEPDLDVNGQVEARSTSLIEINAVEYEMEDVEEMNDEDLKIADEVHESLNVAGDNGQSNLNLEIEASDLANGSLTHSEMEEGGDETTLLSIVSETASEMLIASENEASQAEHQCIVITHLANVIKEPSETESSSGLISNTNIDAEAKALVETKTANNLASPDDKASQTEVSKFIDTQLSNSSENVRCLPSFERSNPETEDGVLVAENAESSLVGPESVILENEVGDSDSTTTVDVAPLGIKVSDDGAEIENIGGERSQTALAYSTDDAVPNIHVKNGPVGGETILTFPAEYVSSETVIEFGSIGSHAKPSISRHDDARLVSVDGQSSAIGSRGMPDDDAVQPTSEILDASVSSKEIGPNSIAEIADGENISIPETEDREGFHSDGLPTSSVEGSVSGAIDGQNEVEIPPRPFNFLIRIPRFEDESLREEIRNAQQQVVEKTQQRDVIRAEIQIKKAHCQTCSERFDAARIGATTARRLVRLKRQEIDVVQAVINRVKNAISVEDIDSRIYGMEHMIEHETLPLKEEKQLIREIKQLKHLREQLSSNMGSQDEVERALDQKDHIEERLKSLRKELESLKDDVSKADAAAIAAKKKLDDERRKESELKAQFRAADDVRQQAYMHFVSLKRQLYDKSKNFRTYKDDLMTARDFASRGDKEALHRLCGYQVETLMELWNTDDEFRKEYIRCNMSTGRRYRTLDGLALGPDEEPPTLPVDDKADRKLVTIPVQSKSISVVSTVEQEMPISSLLGDNQAVDKAREKLAVKNKQIAKSEETVGHNLASGSVTISGRDEAPEVRKEEDNMQTREEQEFTRKEEELRKEEAAAKLKEQRRLEEKAKAEAALERKKRNAEKAQLRAELRAQKEAEQREKEKEKRLRKKEKKMVSTGDGHGGNNNSEEESESSAEITWQEGGEAVVRESRGGNMSRRPQRQPPHVLARQLNKPKPIPPALMNKNKKRMQQYLKMVALAALVVAVFFLSHTAMVQNFSKEKVLIRARGPGNGMY